MEAAHAASVAPTARAQPPSEEVEKERPMPGGGERDSSAATRTRETHAILMNFDRTCLI